MSSPKRRQTKSNAISANTECACGSSRLYDDCCGVFHRGHAAPTAVLLMRSRYTAFVRHDARYLLATWHPRTRPAQLDFDPAQRFLGLKIVSSEFGLEADTVGRVAFVARYKIAGKGFRLVENSRFERTGDRWFYVDGQVGAG